MKPRILFVDDEESILKGLEFMLFRQRRRWDMVFAANGLEALDQVQQAPFDVVVTDRRMPGISGEELIKRVLQTAGRTACIILTGDMEECDNRPEAAVYITKPCKYEELVAAIEEGIERSRGEGTAVT